MEAKRRTIVKSITWRISGIVFLSLISYMITSDAVQMTKITIVFNFIQSIWYYFHERIWLRVEWGRKK